MIAEPASGPASDDHSCAAIARRSDPDRFLSALFAPAGRREGAFVLIAFNHELVRALEMPSARSGAGPIATLIRLQWWREVVDGERDDWHGHEVATGVRTLIETNAVAAATLGGIVAAREAEADGLASVADWRQAMLDGAGGLQRALGELLGVPAVLAPRLADAGAAYACGTLRRHLAVVLRAGRCPLPDEMLATLGTDRETLLQDPGAELLLALSAVLEREGQRFFDQAGQIRLPKAQIASVLPLVLAGRDLGRTGQGDRGIGDRLAVVAAYLSGVVGRGPGTLPLDPAKD